MESTAKGKATLAWIISWKHTSLQLWYLGIVSKWREETQQFKQLSWVIGIKWPHRITNNKLYQVSETESLSIAITERKWKLPGHILRLPADCPERKDITSYFEERTNKKFIGRRRATIVTTIDKDVRRKK